MARTIDKRIMLDLIIEAKKTDPEAGPFSEWLAEYLVDHLPTITPQNEWVSVEESLPEEKQRVIVRCERVGTSVGWILCGAGKVTHWMPLPAPPGKDNNVPAKTPNEPLTQEDIDKMHFDRVWIDYGLDDSGERCGEDGVILYGKLYSIDTLDGSAFEDLLLNACDGETLGRPSGDYTVYRRPPEGEETPDVKLQTMSCGLRF